MINRFLPLLLLIGAVLACSNGPRIDRQSSREALRNRNQASPTASEKGSGWGYSESTDEMGRGKVYHTSIQSRNTISLGFPYEGEQHGFLALREHPQYGRDVYIRIEKGQLLDSDYNDNVLVRFDEERPISFPSVRPADLSTETLFLRGKAFPTFLTKLKSAKTVRIEVPVYQAGTQVFVFDVEGFTWKK